jgi:hypothetical protein
LEQAETLAYKATSDASYFRRRLAKESKYATRNLVGVKRIGREIFLD